MMAENISIEETSENAGAPQNQGKKEMISTMAIEYLQDPDAPHPTNKIWCYING